MFELGDAVLLTVHANSFAEFSLSPAFRRQWPSVYEALQDGRPDRSALLRLYLDQMVWVEHPILVGDYTAWSRLEAYTLRDRTIEHQPHRARAGGARPNCYATRAPRPMSSSLVPPCRARSRAASRRAGTRLPTGVPPWRDRRDIAPACPAWAAGRPGQPARAGPGHTQERPDLMEPPDQQDNPHTGKESPPPFSRAHQHNVVNCGTTHRCLIVAPLLYRKTYVSA